MKKKIKAFMPDPNKIREHKSLRCLGSWIHNPNLWHFNRRSVSGAFAVGMFFAFVPVPFQMVLGALGAVVFSVNLPLSVALVWLTNPLTMPVLFYFAYLVGAMALGTPPVEVQFELTWEWLETGFLAIWQPFLFGCFLVGTTLSVVSFALIRLLWRWHIVQHLKERKLRKINRKKQADSHPL